MERERPKVQVEHSRCPFCHDAVLPGQEKEGCKECMAWHHLECWESHGRCSACGNDPEARPAPAAPLPTTTPRPSAGPPLTLRPPRAPNPGHVGFAGSEPHESEWRPPVTRCERDGCAAPAAELDGSVLAGPRCAEHGIAETRHGAKMALVVGLPAFGGLSLLLAAGGAAAELTSFSGLLTIGLGVVAALMPVMAIDQWRSARRWEEDLELQRRVDAHEQSKGL